MPGNSLGGLYQVAATAASAGVLPGICMPALSLLPPMPAQAASAARQAAAAARLMMILCMHVPLLYRNTILVRETWPFKRPAHIRRI